MNANWKGIVWILGAGIAAAMLVVWFFYFKTPQAAPDEAGTSFGTAPSRTSTAAVPAGDTNGTLPISSGQSSSKIFKISDGPVVGATLIDTTRPTSTIARFTLANNGHTFDLLLDSQGAVPKAISNTTIPGINEVLWSGKGRGVLLRYLDQGTIKTAHLSLPLAGATTTSSVRLQFLPGGISRMAVSPDGERVVYLLKTASGADGYTARADGGDAQKLFSLPLSQIEISWPSAGVILAYSAPATGVGGIVFSINSASGAVTPLMYAEGVTATANRDFSRILYQTSGSSRTSYTQNLKTGLSRPLSFSPIPELCRWSLATTTVVYCAAPITYVAPNFLDLFHAGLADNSMSLLSYNLNTGVSSIVAAPGSTDGGRSQSITALEVSVSDKYLLFITKGDRSLWGVRLSN
jgi:hypothetical protein